MPDPGYLNNLPGMIDAIDNPVRSKDNFAKRRNSMLWNTAADLWVVLQHVGLRHELIGERFSSLRIVTRDETNDVVEVVTRKR